MSAEASVTYAMQHLTVSESVVHTDDRAFASFCSLQVMGKANHPALATEHSKVVALTVVESPAGVTRLGHWACSRCTSLPFPNLCTVHIVAVR